MLFNTLHNNLYSRLIFQYILKHNKTNLLCNIKYTQNKHNVYTLKNKNKVRYITGYIGKKLC